MKRILACIDASSYASSVCELAAWAATRLSASVELLHVVQRKDAVAARNDLSGAIGLGVKSELLEELTQIDEAEGKLAIGDGRVLLAQAEKLLLAGGVSDVNRLHRHGSVVDTIIEREAEADLVVIGKRGATSEFDSDHIGSRIERVVRASVKPVLIASRKIQPPGILVVALDGSSAALKALDFVVGSPLFTGMQLHLVAAGPKGTADKSWFVKAYSKVVDRSPSCIIHIADGAPQQVLGDYMSARRDAILVMGAYGHSALRTLIFGSTTTTVLRTVRAPVLLVR
ncbi:universal stress protein [Anderseniella sp. Alg231-50]|uniref:universal stress protein n=1 Tax=Anderseniella sp. Alg231-50 TaxID=1922226 RepID=UPI000D5601C4